MLGGLLLLGALGGAQAGEGATGAVRVEVVATDAWALGDGVADGAATTLPITWSAAGGRRVLVEADPAPRALWVQDAAGRWTEVGGAPRAWSDGIPPGVGRGELRFEGAAQRVTVTVVAS